MLKVFDTQISSAEENMAVDARLLSSLHPDQDPILHLYEWSHPSVTYGYFIKLEDYFDIDETKRIGLHMARRPTGGGIIFHVWDYAFSFLMPANHWAFSPNTLDNYRFVNDSVIKVVETLIREKHISLLQNQPEKKAGYDDFCMAKSTIYDVMMDNKKIAGAAQRRKVNGYLHQGSISIGLPDRDFLYRVLREEKKNVVEAMVSNAYPLINEKQTINAIRKEIKQRLTETLYQKLKEKNV